MKLLCTAPVRSLLSSDSVDLAFEFQDGRAIYDTAYHIKIIVASMKLGVAIEISLCYVLRMK